MPNPPRGPRGAPRARGSDCSSTEQVKEALYPDTTSCLLAQRRRTVSIRDRSSSLPRQTLVVVSPGILQERSFQIVSHPHSSFKSAEHVIFEAGTKRKADDSQAQVKYSCYNHQTQTLFLLLFNSKILLCQCSATGLEWHLKREQKMFSILLFLSFFSNLFRIFQS